MRNELDYIANERNGELDYMMDEDREYSGNRNDDYADEKKHVDGRYDVTFGFELIDEAAKLPLLTQEETIELAKRKDAGDKEAFNKLVTSNLLLVNKIASRFTGRELERDDLIQEGSLGLIRAVEKYDWTLGFQFSTYAYAWILQAITRALHDKGKTIRIPVHTSEAIGRVKKAQHTYLMEHGKQPTLKELMKMTKLSEKMVTMAVTTDTNVINYNVKINDDETSELIDIIPSDEKSPEEQFIEKSVQEEVGNILKTVLDEREAAVISYRFGLKDGTRLTLQEIGDMYGVSRERIRQIEKKSIEKMGKSKRVKKLWNYLMAN